MFALSASLALAACLKPSSVSELEARVTEAEGAWSALDADGFARSLDDASLLLPCLAEVVPPSFAARYHRILALRTWGAGDLERATWSMVAARSLDPAYAFPDALLAPDHELRRAYEAIPSAPGPSRRPPKPRGGALWFDGSEVAEPTDRATLAQVQGPDGALQTRLLRPGDALPPYEAVPRGRNALLVASGAVAVAGVGLYSAGFATRSTFYGAGPDDVDDLDRLATRTQVFTGAAAGCGALAVAGLIAAVAR